MNKIILFSLIVLGLSSCGPEVGQNVYLGVKGGPQILGIVVGEYGEWKAVRLCTGETYKVHHTDLTTTEEVCPTNE